MERSLANPGVVLHLVQHISPSILFPVSRKWPNARDCLEEALSKRTVPSLHLPMSESCSCENDTLTFMRVSGISCTCKKKGRYTMVTVGFLIRFEAQPGKEADVERALKGALASAREATATIAHFLRRL